MDFGMENNHMVKEEMVDGEEVVEHDEFGLIGGGEDDEDVVSTLTMERVAAAKKFIESHYKSQMKHIQERKER